MKQLDGEITWQDNTKTLLQLPIKSQNQVSSVQSSITKSFVFVKRSYERLRSRSSEKMIRLSEVSLNSKTLNDSSSDQVLTRGIDIKQ